MTHGIANKLFNVLSLDTNYLEKFNKPGDSL